MHIATEYEHSGFSSVQCELSVMPITSMGPYDSFSSLEGGTYRWR